MTWNLVTRFGGATALTGKHTQKIEMTMAIEKSDETVSWTGVPVTSQRSLPHQPRHANTRFHRV